MTDRLDRLFAAARARGLDVLLEHPGDRWRLAAQTTRHGLRAGVEHYRAFASLTEVKGSLVADAAAVLLAEVERTPPDRGEFTT